MRGSGPMTLSMVQANESIVKVKYLRAIMIGERELDCSTTTKTVVMYIENYTKMAFF